MRQAGRYLPEYMAVRKKAGSFKGLLENPEWASEVTVQPVDILGVDAAIIFSDILVIAEALGSNYEMIESRGPVFESPVREMKDLEKLHAIDLQANLKFTLDAIELTVQKLNKRVPLIGFAGAPWTIFAYLVEGQGSKNFQLAKIKLLENSDFSEKLLKLITEQTAIYLNAQIKSGVEVIQIFDSWAGDLSPEIYETFIQPFNDQLVSLLPKDFPIIFFPRGQHFNLHLFQKPSYTAIGLDWAMSVPFAKNQLPDKVLQGNLDPLLLFSDQKKIKQQLDKILFDFPKGKHIFNLGHGLLPGTPVENVKFVIDYVHLQK